jgi:hypothetical protein
MSQYFAFPPLNSRDNSFSIKLNLKHLNRFTLWRNGTSQHRRLMLNNPQHPAFRHPQSYSLLNPVNAELNSICHLLILLGDLKFRGPCILSIFQYISNKMQRYTVYLYLETALHVSRGTSTHHQARIQRYYSIWYLSHRYCYLPLSWKSWKPV